jgi:hypothetical protein
MSNCPKGYRYTAEAGRGDNVQFLTPARILEVRLMLAPEVHVI